MVGGLGVRHRRVAGEAALREALEACAATAGIDVIELPVDTEANVAQHRLVERSVRDAVARAVRPDSPGQRK